MPRYRLHLVRSGRLIRKVDAAVIIICKTERQRTLCFFARIPRALTGIGGHGIKDVRHDFVGVRDIRKFAAVDLARPAAHLDADDGVARRKVHVPADDGIGAGSHFDRLPVHGQGEEAARREGDLKLDGAVYQLFVQFGAALREGADFVVPPPIAVMRVFRHGAVYPGDALDEEAVVRVVVDDGVIHAVGHFIRFVIVCEYETLIEGICGDGDFGEAEGGGNRLRFVFVGSFIGEPDALFVIARRGEEGYLSARSLAGIPPADHAVYGRMPEQIRTVHRFIGIGEIADPAACGVPELEAGIHLDVREVEPVDIVFVISGVFVFHLRDEGARGQKGDGICNLFPAHQLVVDLRAVVPVFPDVAVPDRIAAVDAADELYGKEVVDIVVENGAERFDRSAACVLRGEGDALADIVYRGGGVFEGKLGGNGEHVARVGTFVGEIDALGIRIRGIDRKAAEIFVVKPEYAVCLPRRAAAECVRSERPAHLRVGGDVAHFLDGHGAVASDAEGDVFKGGDLYRKAAVRLHGCGSIIGAHVRLDGELRIVHLPYLRRERARKGVRFFRQGDILRVYVERARNGAGIRGGVRRAVV